MTLLTISQIVMDTHSCCRPVKLSGSEMLPITLADRVARMYLQTVRLRVLLVKTFGMLGSIHDGERANAASIVRSNTSSSE